MKRSSLFFGVCFILFQALALNGLFLQLNFPSVLVYNSRRVAEVLLLLVSVLPWLLSSALRQAALARWQLLSARIRAGILLVILWGGLSALQAQSMIYGMLELGLYLSLFFYIVQVSLLARAKVLALGFFLAVFSFSLCFFGYYFNILMQPALLPGSLFMFHLMPGFFNIRFFAQYQVWLLPLLTLPFFYTQRRAIRVLALLVLVINWVLAYYDLSRGELLSFLVAAVILIILYRRMAWLWLKIQLAGAMIALPVFYVLFYWLLPVFQHVRLSYNSAGRFQLWGYTLHLIAQHPWFGVGPGNFVFYPNPGSLGHPHNSVLLFAVEWGVPVALAVVAFSGIALRRWCQRFSVAVLSEMTVKSQQVIMALSAAALAGFGYSLVSGVLVMPLSQVSLCVIVGWMWRCYVNTPKGVVMSGRKQCMLFGLLLFGLVLLLWGAMHTGGQALADMGPRFWAH